ncbi:MAG: mechanosensitive ion channel family protein [Gemmatimonadaceae bacterium]
MARDGSRYDGSPRDVSRDDRPARDGSRRGSSRSRRTDPRRTDPRRRVATRRYDTRTHRLAATARLKRFRQQTSLAVAMTGLALLLVGGADADGATLRRGATGQDSAIAAVTQPGVTQPGVAQPGVVDTDDTGAGGVSEEAARSVEEATITIRSLVRGSYRIVPKLAIAVVLLALAALATRLARPLLRYVLASFARAEAIGALVGIGVWLVALGAAVSVLAGDARALLGSVGLFGLALSWALQAPIESFTGWRLNSFRGYYVVGDRILVGDVFGDVYKIDFLTTMVWESGGPGKAVGAAQPTGAIVTFPNSEVLRSNVTNFTRDFPYVWDEIDVGVTNESDVGYAMSVVRGVADRVLGDSMVAPAADYGRLLRSARLEYDVADHAQLYLAPTDSWIDITVRYLVPVRERRRRATELQLALATELARPEHAGRIVGSYPVRRVVNDRGRGASAGGSEVGAEEGGGEGGGGTP